MLSPFRMCVVTSFYQRPASRVYFFMIFSICAFYYTLSCNTACMNLFLRELSKQFLQDTILMCCDGAAWHKSGTLEVPENIVLFHIPPYTPEMNPIEQIWKEIRKRGFQNEVFATLEKVVDRLCDTICSLTPNTIFSITGRDWTIKAFN